MLLQQIVVLVAHACLLGAFSSVASWQRLFFFSHILSHSLILPPTICVLLGFGSSAAMTISSVLFACAFAVAYTKLEKLLQSDKDNVLITASAMLMSVSIVLTSQSGDGANMMGYMIGDILLSDWVDVFIVVAMVALSAVYLFLQWSKIVMYTLDPNMARLAFKNVNSIRFTILLIYAVVTALSTKMFGILLTSSATTMPAIVSTVFAKTPLQTIVFSVIIAISVNLIALLLSNTLDVPLSPTIMILYSVAVICAIVINLFLKKPKHR